MAITKVTRTLLSTGIVDNSNATAITIDSSEQVGIGVSPSNKLEIQHGTIGTGNGSNNTLALRYNSTTLYGQHYMDANGFYHIRADAQGVSGGNLILGGDASVQIWTGSTPERRVTVDTSGNLLVGKTSSAFGTAGVQASASNGLWSTRSSLPPLALNLLSSDGSIVDFYKDGSPVGSIGTVNSTLVIGSGDTGLLFSSGDDVIIPRNSSTAARDAAIDLGDATNRFKDLYLSSKVNLGDTNRNLIYRSANNDILLEAASGLFYRQDIGNTNHSWFTGNSERMRIDSSGRVMVNQTAASAASAGVKMQVNTDILSRGTFAGYFWENRSGITIGSLTGWGGWYSTGTSVHSLYSDGNNIVSINRSSGAYTALSDKNKKKDFEDSTVGLTEVMQLQPKKFRMIDDADDAPKKLGFVAQDVENIIPEAYFEDTNEDASGVESTFIGLTDRPIIAALTKAIQEQQTIIDDLKTRIETLESA
jgi:hypothetical protein